jgi:Zn-dependent M28 family amino/carboxypeptidase
MLTNRFLKDYRQKKAIMRNSGEIIRFLSVSLGERTLRRYDNFTSAMRFIEQQFALHGGEAIEEEYFAGGRKVSNIIAEIPGSVNPSRIIIIGAHYDTIEETPGADDNASGIAGLLELYRLLSADRYRKTIRFIAFTLEEPPFFSGDEMGSMVSARNSRQKNEPIDLMICLEMIGYAHRKYHQHVPFRDMARYFPKKGDFLAVASLPSYAEYAYIWKKIYNKYSKSSIVDIVGPSSIPGITHSDHYSYNRHGFPAIMLTDTAFYRNKNYHTECDTIDTINFSFMAEHILNTCNTIREIADMDRIV